MESMESDAFSGILHLDSIPIYFVSIGNKEEKESENDNKRERVGFEK